MYIVSRLIPNSLAYSSPKNLKVVLLFGAAIVVEVSGDVIVIVDVESTQFSLLHVLFSYVNVKFLGKNFVLPSLSTYGISITLPINFKVIFSHSLFSYDSISMSLIIGRY